MVQPRGAPERTQVCVISVRRPERQEGRAHIGHTGMGISPSPAGATPTVPAASGRGQAFPTGGRSRV